MRLLILCQLLLAGILCFTSGCFEEKDNVYNLGDLEDDLRIFFMNEGLDHPGRVCGKFKPGETGCFLLLKNKKGKASKLVYRSEIDETVVHEIDPPASYVYLVKYDKQYIQSHASLNEEKQVKLATDIEAVALHYFEKSSMVFYWNRVETQFNLIGVSD